MVNKLIVSAAQTGPSTHKQGKVDKHDNVRRLLNLMEKAVEH